jgi:hypothetical protein
MKKNYILTLLLTLFISGFSFGQEMLVNGNLESWDDTSTPTSWDKAENLTQETTEVHGGSNSALRNAGSGTKDLSQNITGIVGGDSYTISVWYKADGDGSDARIWSFWRTGTTNLDDNVAELRGPNNSYFDNNGNTWSEYSVTLDAPEAADAFFFEVRSYAQSTVYWDDLSFVHNTSYDLLEDFETALPAAALAGDSGMATTPEVVADPATGGTNGDVLKIVTSAGGNGWQNAQLFFQGDLLDLTTDDKVVTVDVYSESAFMMLAKTATPSNGGAESATDASHTGSGWETLTFDFSDPKDNTPVANDIFGRILFFPQWNGAGWNDSSVTTTYVDNIKGIGYESTPPTGDNSVTIATTQAWNSYVNVFSVSDNTYQFGFGDIEVADLRATATETSVTLEPNISIWTNESTNAVYFDQDAATQTPVAYIEASTYIENSSLANNALTFSGNISTSDLGDGYTVIAFIKSLTSGYSQVAFKSVDISSTGDFTVTATAEEMSQAVIQYGFAVTGPLADPSDTTLGSVVIGAETLGIEDTDIVNVSVYPNPSNSNWNFRTPNTVITSVEVFNLLGKRVVLRKNNSTDIAISTQGLTSGIYIARITTEQGTKSVKLIKE